LGRTFKSQLFSQEFWVLLVLFMTIGSAWDEYTTFLHQHYRQNGVRMRVSTGKMVKLRMHDSSKNIPSPIVALAQKSQRKSVCF